MFIHLKRLDSLGSNSPPRQGSRTQTIFNAGALPGAEGGNVEASNAIGVLCEKYFFDYLLK